MGMTDKQFESYQKGLLRQLEVVENEVKSTSGTSQMLEKVIQDLEDALKRP